MKRTNGKEVFMAVLMALPIFAFAASKKNADVFYVYQDKLAQVNHYVPSGFMGDWGAIKVNEGWIESPYSGRTCIRIDYDGRSPQGANWAGVYWQHPVNNWGEIKGGGYDLSAYRRLTLWARGEKGGENLAKFCMGGITGTYADSDAVEIGPISLTKEWKKYTIDLKGHDLKTISGGLCWAASHDENPNGFTFYIDEIRYEK